jgi:xylulokinase
MEAIAFAVKRNIDVLEDLGIKVTEIRSLGSGSRSFLWSQIKADVTQRTVYTTQNEEAACLGAAMLAGVLLPVFIQVLVKRLQKWFKLKSV